MLGVTAVTEDEVSYKLSLAWSACDDDVGIIPDPGKKPLTRIFLGTQENLRWAAVILVFLLPVVAIIALGSYYQHRAGGTATAAWKVSVEPTPSAAPPTTVISTVVAAPSTVTEVISTPQETASEVTPPPPSVVVITVPSPVPDAQAADQRFLDRMGSLGYTVADRSAALRVAHQVCRLFRQGETPEQIDQQLEAQTRSSPTDVLELVSSAMLSYPDCG